MLLSDSPNPHTKQRHSDFNTIEELGSAVGRIAALLRAVTIADRRDDEGWLTTIALDEAKKAENLYEEWGLAPRQERA